MVIDLLKRKNKNKMLTAQSKYSLKQMYPNSSELVIFKILVPPNGAHVKHQNLKPTGRETAPSMDRSSGTFHQREGESRPWLSDQTRVAQGGVPLQIQIRSSLCPDYAHTQQLGCGGRESHF